jgi:hypothetical protein
VNELLKNYQLAVTSPYVSGFEHLQMLDIRDDLELDKTKLTLEELELLAKADHQLLTLAADFYAELSKIADLAQERHQHNPPPSHWWWYLDVLTQVPALSTNGRQTQAPALTVVNY